MNRWLRMFFTPLFLIMGFTIIGIAYSVGSSALTYVLAELESRVAEKPAYVIVIANVIIIVLVGYLVTRKAFRLSLNELWKQLRRNL